MTSSDSHGDNDLLQVEIVTHSAEGTTSDNDRFDAAQSNDFDIVQGLLSVVLVCTVCVAHFLGLMLANRVSVALAPVPPVIIVHALYLGIHAIKKRGFAPVSTLERTPAFIL